MGMEINSSHWTGRPAEAGTPWKIFKKKIRAYYLASELDMAASSRPRKIFLSTCLALITPSPVTWAFTASALYNTALGLREAASWARGKIISMYENRNLLDTKAIKEAYDSFNCKTLSFKTASRHSNVPQLALQMI